MTIQIILNLITYNVIGDNMSKKDEFKEFVKKNPKLINYVKKGESTWQKFYEMFDLYGEDKTAWDEYLGVATVSAAGILDFLKNIDLDSLQNGVNSIQRVVGVLQEMGNKKEETTTEYKPRPIYKSFDDQNNSRENKK